MFGLALLAFYILVVIYVTARSERGKNAFYVNNRSSSALGIALSGIASALGASATIGVIGKAFSVGAPAFWWLGSGAAGACALSVLLAKKVRDSGASTMPEMTAHFLGRPSRPLVSLIIVIAWLGILAAQFAALQRVMLSLTGFDANVCLILSFALVALHSTGGQAAVMRLDQVQTPLILGGLALVLVWLCTVNPQWSSGLRFEAVNEDFPPSSLFHYILVVGGNFLICPMLFSRFLSARDARAAKRGGLLVALGLVFASLLVVSIGLAARGFVPVETAGDAVLTTALGQSAPHWMQSVVLLALVGAVVSSADTCLVTAATVLSHDLLRRDSPACRRSAVLLIGLASLALSLTDKSILGFLLMAYEIFACGVAAPVLLGMLASPRRAVRSVYACVAVGVGGGFGVASSLCGDPVFSYTGMGAAALITLLGLKSATVANVCSATGEPAACLTDR